MRLIKYNLLTLIWTLATSLHSSLASQTSYSSSPCHHHQYTKGVYQARFFDQRLDNWQLVKFQQRYYVNADYYRSGGPAFLYITGEQAASNRSVSDGLITLLAKEHGGIIYSLEHRYYGLSHPFNDTSATNLRFLSSRHALSDIINFSKSIINPITGKKNKEWYAMGGSYAGALAAWLRKFEPKLFRGTLASSAPIMAKEDFHEYDNTVRLSLGRKCSKVMRWIVKYIDDIYLNDFIKFNKLKFSLGCQGIDDDIHFLFTMYDTISGIIQYNTPDSSPSVASLCDGLKSNSIKSLNHFIDTINQYYTNFQTTCQEFSYQSDIQSESIKEFSMMRQWTYQSCTEFGFWQTAPPTNAMRSKFLTKDWFNNFFCSKHFFGFDIGPPKIGLTNRLYGGRCDHTQKVIFTNGDHDPWSTLSLSNPRLSTPQRPILLIKGGSHVTDLDSPSSTDSRSLNLTRAKIQLQFRHWIQS